MDLDYVSTKTPVEIASSRYVFQNLAFHPGNGLSPALVLVFELSALVISDKTDISRDSQPEAYSLCEYFYSPSFWLFLLTFHFNY